MRPAAIAILIALIPQAALAQSMPAINSPGINGPTSSKPATKPQPAATPKAQPEKRAKSCEEYGAGFKPIEGTGTCVKIGGYVRMQGSAR